MNILCPLRLWHAPRNDLLSGQKNLLHKTGTCIYAKLEKFCHQYGRRYMVVNMECEKKYMK